MGGLGNEENKNDIHRILHFIAKINKKQKAKKHRTIFSDDLIKRKKEEKKKQILHSNEQIINIHCQYSKEQRIIIIIDRFLQRIISTKQEVCHQNQSQIIIHSRRHLHHRQRIKNIKIIKMFLLVISNWIDFVYICILCIQY